MTHLTASATLVSTEPKRPPKQVLRVDLTIDGTPRDGWLLVADTVRTSDDVSPRGIHTIDRYEVAPGCDLVWLKGERGVLALRPGKTRLRVHDLAISRWGDGDVVGIVTTGRITVGGRPLDELFDAPVDRWPHDDVDAGAFSVGSTIVQRLTADFERPFRVVLDDAVAHRVRLD